jgi:8-oxo-dGTP pyrophosphatase MutT (NUDIX family)
MRARRTARIFLFDAKALSAHHPRVLLIRFVVPRPTGDFVFWLTPGGEIGPEEAPAEAATRELREELGLVLPVVGPAYTERNQFEHGGEMRDNTDFFFTARCAPEAPRLAGITPEEIAVMREIRWWSAAAIHEAEAAGTRFFPVDILTRIRLLFANTELQ